MLTWLPWLRIKKINLKGHKTSQFYTIPVTIDTVVSGEWENKPFIGWEVKAGFKHLGDDKFHSNSTSTGSNCTK